MLEHKNSSSLLLAIVLLIAPLAIWGEKFLSEQWQERLVIPKFEVEPDRHSSRFWSGTALPRTIRQDLVISPAQNPIFIYGTTAIPAGRTLTIEAGTKIYVQEFAGLNVSGTLNIAGEENNPVGFASNENHPDNQMWSGLVVDATGTANVNYAKITGAAPAFTCLPDSTANITNTDIAQGSMGFFTASSKCELANSIIRGFREGVVSIDTEPNLPNSQVTATNPFRKIITN